MELHEDVAGVELAAEQGLHAELAKELVGPVALRHRVLQRGLLGRPLLHLGKFEHHGGVLDGLRERIERPHVRAFGVRRGDNLLGLRLVVPERGLGLLRLQRGQLRAAVGDLHVVGHFGDTLLQRRNPLADLFDFQQLLFDFFCHNSSCPGCLII